MHNKGFSTAIEELFQCSVNALAYYQLSGIVLEALFQSNVNTCIIQCFSTALEELCQCSVNALAYYKLSGIALEALFQRSVNTLA